VTDAICVESLGFLRNSGRLQGDVVRVGRAPDAWRSPEYSGGGAPGGVAGVSPAVSRSRDTRPTRAQIKQLASKINRSVIRDD